VIVLQLHMVKDHSIAWDLIRVENVGCHLFRNIQRKM